MGSDPGSLLRGAALAEAERWMHHRPVEINKTEKGFFQASLAARAQEQESRERRRSILTGSLGAGVLVAIALAAVALWQRSIAIENETIAIEQTNIAKDRLVEANAQRQRAEDALAISQTKESLFLAKAAREELNSGNPLTSVQLALRGLPAEEERPFVPEAFGALVESFNEQRKTRIFITMPEGGDASHYATFVPKVRFSHNGSLLLATSYDNAVRVWGVGTGKEVSVLRGHEDPADWALFSPDENRVLTSSFDGTTRLWDAGTGKQISILKNSYVRSAAFSPDGSRILVVDNSGTVQLWDVASERSVWIWHGAKFAVTNQNGEQMLTIPADANDRVSRLWDVATGKQVTTLKSNSPIKVASFNPNGNEIVTALEDNSIHFWNATTGEQVGELEDYREPLNSISYSPDGSSIVTVSEAFDILLWDAATRSTLPVSLGRNAGSVHSVAFSPDSSLVLVASAGDRVRLLETATGLEVLSLNVYEVESAQFAPDGKSILTVSNDQTIALWDITNAEKVVHFLGHQGVVNDVAFSRDNSKVLSASKDGTARIWDAATGRPLQTLTVETGSVGTAAFSADGKHVLTTSGDGQARLWDAGEGREILALNMGERWLISAHLSNDGERILTASAKSTRLWDAATGRLIADLEHRDHFLGYKAVFSPNDTMILTTSDIGEACLWDGVTGEKLDLCLSSHSRGEQAYATFSPDSKIILVPLDNFLNLMDAETGTIVTRMDVGDRLRLATFSKDGTKILAVTNKTVAQLWNAEAGTRVALLEGHQELISQAVFGPNGDTILTASYDNTVRLWNVSTGKQLAILRGRRGKIGKIVAYAPQGQRILIVSEDNIVSALWIGANPEQMIHFAHDRLPVAMTADQERKFYITTGSEAN